MIVVCTKDLQDRLDRAWFRLQRVVEGRHGHSISQVQADEETVSELEKTVAYLHAEASRKPGSPPAAQVKQETQWRKDIEALS